MDKKDFKNLALSSVSRFSYQLALVAVLFFLTPLMIKTLGDYRYGIWALVNIFANYCGYAELGITSAVQRYLAVAVGNNDREEFNNICNNGFFLNIIIAVIITIISIITAVTMNLLEIKDYSLISILVMIMGGNLGLTFLFKSFFSVISAHIRFDIISSVQLFQLILNSALVAMLLLNNFGLVEISLCTLFTTFFANLLYFYFSMRLAKFNLLQFQLINKNTIKKLLGYSGKSFSIQVAEILRFKTDELITAVFISVSLVTPYSVANKLNRTANTFNLSFIGVLNPFFSRYVDNKPEQYRVRLFFLVSKVVIAMSCFIFFSFLLVGFPFLGIWLGDNYTQAYLPMIILAFSYFAGFSQAAGVQYMFSTNTHQHFAYLSIFEGIVNIICSIIFVVVFKLGIVGVALGTLAPVLLTKTYFQPRIASKILNIRLTEYYSFFIINLLKGLLLYIIAGSLILQAQPDSYTEIFLSVFGLGLVAAVHFVLMLGQEVKAPFEKFSSIFRDS